MSKKYKLMIDPTPQGWVYGFPRALPDEAVMGKGSDLWIKTDFDLTKWVCNFGYPEDSFQYYKLYPQEIKDEAAEKMGDLKFTTAGEYLREEEKVKYVYPGQDCQE